MSSLDRPLLRPPRRLPAHRLALRCHGPRRHGLHHGSPTRADPMDVRHARLVLLWGTNTRAHQPPPLAVHRAGESGRGEVVVIDPLRTATAEAADWFMQPLPGTDNGTDARRHARARPRRPDRPRLRRSLRRRLRRARRAGGRVDARNGPRPSPASTPGRSSGSPGAYGTARPAFIRTLIGAEHHEHGAGSSHPRPPAVLPGRGATSAEVWPGRSAAWSRAGRRDGASTPPGADRAASTWTSSVRALTDPRRRRQRLVRLVRQPRRCRVPNAGWCAEAWPVTTCSPWSASSS